jgi:hypothetical protein
VLNNNFKDRNFDFTAYTITFRIQHTTESNTYHEDITIVQYPAIYGEQRLNNYAPNTGQGYIWVNEYINRVKTKQMKGEKRVKKHIKFRVQIFLVLCSMIISYISFADVRTFATETVSEEYNQAVALMRKIGVLDAEMEYDPTAVVCRQDLAVYIAKLLGATEAEVECRYFVDVPEGSYGTWAINYLTERGIFNINSQHLFNPKAETNTDEVYKVLTTALGYGRYAEAKGGYPVGYRMAARTAEISFGDIERLNFQTLMVMIYRASTARLYEPVSI